jgi:hypothetical protein
MKLIGILFLIAISFGVSTIVCALFHIQDLNDQLKATQTELSVAIVEKQTCEMLVKDGLEAEQRSDEASQAAIRGVSRCLFDCDVHDCYDRCQSCYSLIKEVSDALTIKNR